MITLELQELTEQLTKIEELEKNFALLEASLDQCCNNKTTTYDSGIQFGQHAVLEQNIPSPFSQTTEINHYLPPVVKSATLYIYDIEGTLIKQTDIGDHGNGKVVIGAGQLMPGVYFYSLFADGKEVDTKRMILTK